MTHTGNLNALPAFSPDGRYVAYIQFRDDGMYDLRLVDLETDEETKVAEDVLLLRPAWRRAPKSD
ncbi:MAG: hypothetical protein WD872_05465 [Pirellulaceae bacterium]